MQLIKIEFFHQQQHDTKDQLDKCIELYPEIDRLWMPMSIFIGDKIEVYLEKNIDK